ncbi:hypothetical protein Amet_1817 [Alkaliphilus metalliredigens QYMF]|uniref:Uncharacterized protein n=1 Tax=Alkaliphilus metalliredigens (strain QYMF) TaxID=293826 RepID=A6TP69_ALKMQ|nr:hypothetical protein [Alkaliphilus metalliredigens]ABR47987.1 hypothetical protein Amet_1817 [Alkaliphilus metalliredigens QYMF]
MKNINTKKIAYFLIYLLILGGIFYARNNFDRQDRFNSRMYYDFQDFGRAVEELNDDLLRILVLEDLDFPREKSFINRNALLNFQRSKGYAADRGRYQSYHEYQVLYNQVNTVIDNILMDGSISPSEEGYLKALYNYSEALIHEYRGILGNLYDEWHHEELKRLQKNIVAIYEDFSTQADILLKSEEYSFLQDYRGDFPEANFSRAKAFSEENFSKIISNQSLDFDNKDEEHMDKFIFSTHVGRDSTLIYENNDPFHNATYQVEYHKDSKEVTLTLRRAVVPPKEYTEEELDALAEEILSPLDHIGFLYKRKVNFMLDDGGLSSITHSYIEKIDGIYDEQRKIQLILESSGLIREFYIVDHDNVEMTPPSISKEEILQQINPEAVIKEIFKVRNLEGEIEYEVHFTYGDTSYGAIFDGDSGELKYTGRNMRKYNQS